MRLKEKVAIITGAGSSGPGIGTGKAISSTFAKEGAKVVLVDKDLDRANETLELIKNEGNYNGGFAISGDVTSIKDCEKIVSKTINEFGKLDILVNNVGILAPGNVINVTEENYDVVMSVNLKSMILMSKYAIPQMIENKGGSIINMSSFLGLRSGSVFESIPYSVSKGGIIALTTTMASEHGREGIRVNAIAPGYLYTPMVAGKMTDKQRELRRNASPLGTEGTAWDVAWGALYLASEESRWVTGIVLPIDGGILATSPLSMHHHLKDS